MKSENPKSYLITSGKLTPENYLAEKSRLLSQFKLAVDSGVSLIQIREKVLPARMLFELASEAVLIRGNTQTKILINDRADAAIAAKADGVHLTTNSIPAEGIRENFPPNMIIGMSAHSLEDIKKAKRCEVDFAVFGPIYHTPSKAKYGSPQGIDELKRVLQNAEGFPIFAIGGISEENLSDILNLGVSGVAAIRLFENTENMPDLIGKIEGRI